MATWSNWSGRHASLIPFREPPLSASDFWGPRLLDAHQPVAPVVATTTLSALGREMWSLLPCQGVVIASGHCLFGATACQADTRCALERRRCEIERRRAARAAVSPFPPCVRLRKGLGALSALPALELVVHHCLVCG